MCILRDTHAHFHTMLKKCSPCFTGKPLLRPGLASSRLLTRRLRRGDDLKRQDVNSKHSRHGSGTFNSKATPLLMSHKVMFVLLGERVCGCLAVCGIEHLLGVILHAYVCAFDGQRAATKRQRSNIPANPVWQVFLPGPVATVTDPPLYIPKMAGQLNKKPPCVALSA